VLKEYAPEVTLDDVRSITEANYVVSPVVKIMEVAV